MKVIISITGRFHYFDLAYQIQKSNYLNKLITTYPKFITKRWKIKTKNIVSFFSLEILKSPLPEVYPLLHTIGFVNSTKPEKLDSPAETIVIFNICEEEFELLDSHHIVSKKYLKFPNNKPSNKVSLCPNCHRLVHLGELIIEG